MGTTFKVNLGLTVFFLNFFLRLRDNFAKNCGRREFKFLKKSFEEKRGIF